MRFPTFIKLPSYYVFDYKPLYYNPKKEEREKREKKIKQEMGLTEDDNIYIPGIKGEMKRMIAYRRQDSKTSNLRLLVILIFLVVLAYFIFFY